MFLTIWRGVDETLSTKALQCLGMSSLYTVRLFLRFAQIIGAMPYSFTVDENEEQLIISFRWRSFSCLWFVLVTLGNFLSLLLTTISMARSVIQDTSKAIATFSLCSYSSQFIFLFSSRWIVVQSRKWNRAVKLFKMIEVEETFPVQSKNTKLQIALFFSWVLGSVS